MLSNCSQCNFEHVGTSCNMLSITSYYPGIVSRWCDMFLLYSQQNTLKLKFQTGSNMLCWVHIFHVRSNSFTCSVICKKLGPQIQKINFNLNLKLKFLTGSNMLCWVHIFHVQSNTCSIIFTKLGPQKQIIILNLISFKCRLYSHHVITCHTIKQTR